MTFEKLLDLFPDNDITLSRFKDVNRANKPTTWQVRIEDNIGRGPTIEHACSSLITNMKAKLGEETKQFSKQLELKKKETEKFNKLVEKIL